MDLWLIGISLSALGALAGLLAGMLGIGGGAVLVPGLYYLFSHFGYTEHAMHIAAGTSLLTIIFTGSSSGYSHYKRGAVDLDILKTFLPGIVLGVFMGTLLAHYLGVSFATTIRVKIVLWFGGKIEI